jgi:predicted DNA-binding transcriptional regulator YafY
MRRVDRLFRIVQLIRGRRLTTAAYVAERLEISQRSVYRDIAALQTQGVPIEGEAGVGYRMRRGFDLPPLMFDAAEAQALVASVRIAQSRIDTELARHAEDALAKILAVLPAAERTAADKFSVYALSDGIDSGTKMRLAQLRQAMDARLKLRLDYLDLKDTSSLRTVRPLACFFWDDVWTLAAWCELREDFRNFRVDRIRTLDVLDERFREESGKTLADLFRRHDCPETSEIG